MTTKVVPKQAARAFLQSRAHTPAPLPSLEEIRRQLGFGLIVCTKRRG